MSNEKNSGLNWEKLFALPAMRSEDGKPNLEEALTLLREEGELYIASEISSDTIKNAVETVFSKMIEASGEEDPTLGVNELITRALSELNPSYGEGDKVARSLQKFLAIESDKFERTRGEEGILVIRRGAKGGCHFSSPRYVEEYRKMLIKREVKEAKLQAK